MKTLALFFLLICLPLTALPTYYCYEDNPLGTLESMYCISDESLDKWNEAFAKRFKDVHTETSRTFRFLTYIYNAQRDAAFLSYNERGCFEGSLDPITLKITQMFYPDFEPPFRMQTDPYSLRLASVVFRKYKERFERESSHLWSPWVIEDIKSISIAQAPPQNDTAFWSREMKVFRKARAHMSEREKQLSDEWRYLAGPKGMNWINILNAMIDEEHTYVGQALLARALLMIAGYDALIVSMDYKTDFKVPRPYDIDKETEVLIPKPRSWSYPSAHAALAGASAEIMTHLFPSDSRTWKKYAREMALSRVWSGVHTSFDTSSGTKIGCEVGREVLDTLHTCHQDVIHAQ